MITVLSFCHWRQNNLSARGRRLDTSIKDLSLNTNSKNFYVKRHYFRLYVGSRLFVRLHRPNLRNKPTPYQFHYKLLHWMVTLLRSLETNDVTGGDPHEQLILILVLPSRLGLATPTVWARSLPSDYLRHDSNGRTVSHLTLTLPPEDESSNRLRVVYK